MVKWLATLEITRKGTAR